MDAADVGVGGAGHGVRDGHPAVAVGREQHGDHGHQVGGRGCAAGGFGDDAEDAQDDQRGQVRQAEQDQAGQFQRAGERG